MIVKDTVNFLGEEIQVVHVEREIKGVLERTLAVVAKPFFEGLGVDWKSQRTKMADDPEWYEPFSIKTQGKDGKMYDMVCLPYRKLNLLLAAISAKNIPEDKMVLSIIDGVEVEEPLRQKLRRYQAESGYALHDYWNHGFAMNFRSKPAQFDSEMTFDMLKSSASRFRNAKAALANHIVEKSGKGQGAEFDAEVADFIETLGEEALQAIKGIMEAGYLDIEAAQIRLLGEEDIRPISGAEAVLVGALQSCFADLVSEFRRGQHGENYEALFDLVPEYFAEYLQNSGQHMLRLHSTYKRGKGLL